MKRALQILAIGLAMGSCSPSVNADEHQSPESVYDGRWWVSVGPQQRAGFVNGAGDCLVWVAHAKWLSHSVEPLEQEITEYYQSHPASRTMPVVEVWQRLVSETRPAEPPKDGERWTNPHGYYDGLYWRQGSEEERKGFLEGYLWCMRRCVKSPPATYSRSTSNYMNRIDAYLKAHPKGDDEAIAAILARFRDNPKSAAAPDHSDQK